MIQKERLSGNPPLKPRDEKAGNVIAEVPLAAFPADTLNVVVELLYEGKREWLSRPDVQPPKGASVKLLELDRLLIVLTLLGEDGNLLVRPTPDGFTVSHNNTRYSANAPGVTYMWEAYSGE